MKILLIFALILTGCAGKKTPKYKDDKAPKFASSRTFAESPEIVLRAAKAVLEDLSVASDPPATGAVRIENQTVSTGWVYGKSKDKYYLYDFNGAPRRKELPVRRKYSYTVTPSLAGSDALVSLVEEIDEIDAKTGTSKGWKNAAPDENDYDLMIRKLREKIRAL